MLKLPRSSNPTLTRRGGSYTLEDAKRDQRLSTPFSSGVSVRIITPEEAENERAESMDSLRVQLRQAEAELKAARKTVVTPEIAAELKQLRIDRAALLRYTQEVAAWIAGFDRWLSSIPSVLEWGQKLLQAPPDVPKLGEARPGAPDLFPRLESRKK